MVRKMADDPTPETQKLDHSQGGAMPGGHHLDAMLSESTVSGLVHEEVRLNCGSVLIPGGPEYAPLFHASEGIEPVRVSILPPGIDSQETLPEKFQQIIESEKKRLDSAMSVYRASAKNTYLSACERVQNLLDTMEQAGGMRWETFIDQTLPEAMSYVELLGNTQLFATFEDFLEDPTTPEDPQGVLRDILELAQSELSELIEHYRLASQSEEGGINFGIEMVQSSMFGFLAKGIEAANALIEQGNNAEWSVFEGFREKAESFGNEQFVRELGEMSQRIIRILTGEKEAMPSSDVLVVGPKVEYQSFMHYQEQVRGVLSQCGNTSHLLTAAVALGFPVGCPGDDVIQELAGYPDGTPTLLDPEKGVIILHPSEDTLREYGDELRRARTFEYSPVATVLADGSERPLSLNVDVATDTLLGAVTSLERGVGLTRSEVMWAKSGAKTSDEKLLRDSVRLLRAVKDPTQQVTIRTWDYKDDKLGGAPDDAPVEGDELGITSGHVTEEDNKRLVYAVQRALEILIETEDDEAIQASKTVSILFPDVKTGWDFRKHLHMVHDDIGESFDPPFSRSRVRVSPQIESVIGISNLGEIVEAHFDIVLSKSKEEGGKSLAIKVGTNDLRADVEVQKGKSREGLRGTADLDPLHIPFLKELARLSRRISELNIRYSRSGLRLTGEVCGNLAAQPEFIPILEGMNFNLSVSPAFAARVGDTYSKITSRGCKELVTYLLASKSDQEVRERLKTFCEDRDIPFSL